jgi:hypothetical protein
MVLGGFIGERFSLWIQRHVALAEHRLQVGGRVLRVVGSGCHENPEPLRPGAV